MKKSKNEEPISLGQLSQPEEEPTQTSQVDNTQADTIIDYSQTQPDDVASNITNPEKKFDSPILEEGENSKLSIDSLTIPDKRPPPPSARWAHTMTHIGGNRVLVYGGQTLNDQHRPTILSDIHVYDLEKKTWCKPVNCEGVARQWHSATYLPARNLLISFGGETIHPKTKRISTTDEVMVLDTEIMVC